MTLSSAGKSQLHRVDHHWRQVLKQAMRKPAELLEQLQLDPQLLNGIEAGQRQFPLLAPPAFVQQIEKGNPEDPLFLQIFPQAAESLPPKDLLKDPVGDLASQGSTALLHKYHSRALIITTGACAIHCRYCFRRHFPYSSNSGHRLDWQHTLKYIEQHPNISEIILSGGDPLMLPTQQLHKITQQLSTLPQITTLRIHTRMATCLPERFNTALLAWLKNLPFRLVLVHHINHPNEISEPATKVIFRLKPLIQQQLNQSVLLASVNNNVQTLKHLSELLFTNNILPYYLHQMDRVTSAGHFICSDHEATKIVTELRASLPGYLVPKLVREEAGKSSKTPI
ncbi:MAG: EF-P beta-lysylation protein EpmB [Xanthomonadales bacterium]|nr:EF-P beta-lysylation protein EpmB [Xanthomonadales bacterium]